MSSLVTDNMTVMMSLKPNGRRAIPCRKTLRNMKGVAGFLFCFAF